MEYVPIPLARIFQYASAAPRVSPPEACALISAVHALRSATTPLARIRSNASFALTTSPDRAHAVSTAVQVRIVGTNAPARLDRISRSKRKQDSTQDSSSCVDPPSCSVNSSSGAKVLVTPRVPPTEELPKLAHAKRTSVSSASSIISSIAPTPEFIAKPL
jgi:hypothetical protein